jgi:hypothetical protein
VVFLLAAVFGVLLFHIDARFIEDMNADLEREQRLSDVARCVCQSGSLLNPAPTRFSLRAVS